MLNIVRNLLATLIITLTIGTVYTASAQEVQAEFVRDANGTGFIVFSLGQDNPSETDVAAWVAQQTAAAPKQVSGPQVVSGLSERTISKSYFIQAASFQDRASAQAVVNQFGGEIETTMVKGTQYHRALVGPFVNTNMAKQARSSVVAAGYTDAFVRS